MKKKIALFLVTCMSLASMVGCTPEQKSYMEETKKISKWESFDSTAKVSLDVTMPKMEPQMEGKETTVAPKTETTHLEFDVKGYTLNEKGKNQKGYALLNGKDDKGMLQMKDVKIFVDGQDVYISKNYMEYLMKYSVKKELPKRVTDVKQQYILISNNLGEVVTGTTPTPTNTVFMKNYMDTMTNPEKRDELFTKMGKVFELVEFDVPMKKEGDSTYTVKLDSDQIIEKLAHSIDKTVLNLNEIIQVLELKDMLPKDMKISKIQEQYKNGAKEQIMNNVGKAKEALKGSSIETKETFAEDQYTSETKANIVASGDFEFKFNVAAKTESKKADKKEITVPKKSEAIDLKEYMELYMPAIKDTITLDAKAKTLKSEKTGKQVALKTMKNKEGKTMFEFAPIMKSFGAKVGYDQKAHKVYYMSTDQKIYVEDVVEKNGVSYILAENINYRWASNVMSEDGNSYRYVIIEAE